MRWLAIAVQPFLVGELIEMAIGWTLAALTEVQYSFL